MSARAVRYVAFLRAINVGGHTVRMERLREIIAALGATDVETFIASGNVIFTAASAREVALEQRLEAGLEAALGFPVATFLRTLAEVSAVATCPAFAAADVERATSAGGGALYVGFLKAAPAAAARRAIEGASTPSHRLAIAGREVYWLRADRTEYEGPKFEKLLGPATFRNITTVQKIAARYCGADAGPKTARQSKPAPKPKPSRRTS